MNLKLYLAGPEVFLPHAEKYAEMQRSLCVRHGFTPLHPMDNNIELGLCDYDTAVRIYRGDISQVRECDIVVANCNPFRSVCTIDDGTAYELGFGNALGKPSYGYIEVIESLSLRTARDYPTETWEENPMRDIDKDGYLVTDSFETSINLMMQCGMTENGGRLISGGFEACLCAIKTDLDKGSLILEK